MVQVLEQEKISRIKVLLKAHPKGLTITDISKKLKMNRNSAAKYLEILQISGQVESRKYGMAQVFFLTHRLPISALVSIASDLVVTIDEHYHILFVNKGFCDLFSVQNDDVVGNHIIDIFKTGIGSDVLPGAFSDIIANQEKVHEVCIPRDSGEIFYKIKSMKTVFDDGSRGITIIMEDVTDERKTKIELEAKEARYRGIVEDQIEYVIRFLPNGTLSFVNTSYSRFLDKGPEKLVGTKFSDNIHPKDRKAFDRSLGTLNRENPAAAFECRSAVPAGHVRWIAWTLRVMYDGKKEPVEYQAVGHDITEKKESAERIHQHITQMEFFSEKLQQFIEMPPGADIYHTIANGFSEIFSGAAVCVSCYEPGTNTFKIKAACTERDREIVSRYIGGDILGMKILAGDAASSADFFKGGICKRKESLISILCNQLPKETCASIEDSLNLGEYFSVGLIWQGTLLGNVNFGLRKGEKLRNISLAETYIRAASIALQRSRAENALAESEKMYRTVLENIQDVFYRSDVNGNLIMGSPSWAKMAGYDSVDECIGMNIARDMYMDPEKRKEFLSALMVTGSVTDYEIVLKKKDGSPLYISTNSHLYYGRDGTVLGVEGIFRDISERRAANEKIHQNISAIEFLSQKLLDFITMEASENIYRKIASDIKNLVFEGSIITINSFNTKTGIVTVEAAMMSNQQRDTIIRLMGIDLVGSGFLIDEAGLAGFRTGRLHKLDFPLYEILFKAVPEKICKQLESELDIGNTYAIGFVQGDEVLGSATIFIQHGKTVDNLSLLETYIHEASIALQRYLAEKARRKSDEIFYNIAKNSPLPIALIEPDGTYRFVNECFARVFGYDLNDFHNESEWIRLTFPDPVARETAVATWKADSTNSRTCNLVNRTFSVHCKDGSRKEIIFRPVILSDGHRCIICEDITERHKAEQTYRLLSSIIASTADAVIGKDLSGMVISWNKAAERMYGYTETEIIGDHISRIVPPERRAELEEISSQIQQGISINSLDTQRVRKDGRLIDISVTISPITDDEGTITGASTIARDISPTKAEERLRENEMQYRSLVENIAVGVYRSTGDPAGHFIWGNSSLVKILGYPSFEDLKDVEIADIFVEADGRKKLLADLKKDGFVKNREIALKRADGEVVSVRVTALARFDTGGGLSCINGIVEDITGQRNAEHLIQSINKEMLEILAFVQNPTVIIDNRNVVISWNAAMEQLTGVQKTEVIGSNNFEHLFPFYNPGRPALCTLFDATHNDLDRYYPGAYREGSAIIAQVPDLTHKEEPSVFFTIRASPLCEPGGARIGAMQILQSATPYSRDRTTSPPLDPVSSGTREISAHLPPD